MRGKGNNEAPGKRAQPTEMAYWMPALAGSVDVIGDLSEKARQAKAENRPLRVKLGFDPTAPDIHLGHTVPLMRARAFQDLGATVVLIVGDYTARVGDPTGVNKTRPILSEEAIQENAQTYAAQAKKILREDRLEIRYNSEWIGKMTPSDMFSLLQSATVAQMLERNDFANRYEEGEPISLLEFVYPLLQGHDSVAVNSDIELGGTDQLYNLGVGRKMHGQCLATFEILPGIDGVERMSKSKGNYIGIDQAPDEMFGRFMRIPDEAMPTYWRLASGHPQAEKIAKQLEKSELHPMENKRELARHLIGLYHGADAATEAENVFNQRHVERALPQDVPSYKLQDEELYLPAILQEAFGLNSRNEARAMIQSGGVKIDGVKLDSLDVSANTLRGKVLQLGKRRAVRCE